jgi:cytoskeleton protein RodZ
MPSTPFGEHLKREREMRGVSLDEIAAATKINTRFLEALENGRWNELPGGAFNRGFVRTTSRFLGLDEDDMVAEFALETNGEVQSKALPETSGAMPRDFRPAIVALCVFLLALIAGGWFTYREISIHRHRRAAALAAESAANPAPPAPQPTSSSAASTAVASDASVDASATNSASAPTTSQAAPTAPVASNINPSAPAISEVVAPSKPEKLELKIDASKTAEIRVVGDGNTLFKGRIHADGSKHFEARDGFEVTSSDSTAVQLQLNGQDVPLEGKPGKRGRASLSRGDLKTAVGTH